MSASQYGHAQTLGQSHELDMATRQSQGWECWAMESTLEPHVSDDQIIDSQTEPHRSDDKKLSTLPWESIILSKTLSALLWESIILSIYYRFIIEFDHVYGG